VTLLGAKCLLRRLDRGRGLEPREQLAAGGAADSQPLYVPRIELAQVTRGAVRAQVPDRALADPVQLGQDLAAARLLLVTIQELREEPRVAERAPGEQHGGRASPLERRPCLVGRL